MKYAYVVKNAEGTWDIYRQVDDQWLPQAKLNRIINAVNSGLPITGMDLTQYRDAACAGAIWNGTTFEGGEKQTFSDEFDWDHTELYGYVCDGVILIVMICSQPSHRAQYGAIFDGETTIVELPDNSNAKVGDIWDGEKVISI